MTRKEKDQLAFIIRDFHAKATIYKEEGKKAPGSEEESNYGMTRSRYFGMSTAFTRAAQELERSFN